MVSLNGTKLTFSIGWADVDLSEKGTQQAIDADKLDQRSWYRIWTKLHLSIGNIAIKTTNLAQLLTNCGFQLKIMALETNRPCRWVSPVKQS